MGVGAAAAGTAATVAAYTALATAAVGAGVAAYGSIQQAQAASKNAAYQAQVAKNNQTIAGYNAEAATQAGEAKMQQVGAEERARLGAIDAGEAATGRDINRGSNVDVRASQRQTGLYDTAMTQHDAYLQAYGYKAQGTNFGAQAGLDTAQSKQATALAPLTAASTLLEGASSLGSKYTQFQTQGVL